MLGENGRNRESGAGCLELCSRGSTPVQHALPVCFEHAVLCKTALSTRRYPMQQQVTTGDARDASAAVRSS